MAFISQQKAKADYFQERPLDFTTMSLAGDANYRICKKFKHCCVTTCIAYLFKIN